MAEQKNDSKSQTFFESLRKKGRQRLDAFIFKNEDEDLEQQQSPPQPPEVEIPKHPLYEYWILWQQDSKQDDAGEIDISEEGFRAWFGHDIDLEIKKEEPSFEEEPDEKADDKHKGLKWFEKQVPPAEEEKEVLQEEIPKPEPTAAQLFCDALTHTADDLVRNISLERRLAEAEIQMKRDKAEHQAEQAKEEPVAGMNETDKFEKPNEAVLPTQDGNDEEILEEDPYKIVMKPRDCIVKTYISKDVMSGYIFVFPPLYGGKGIDEESLNDALKKGKIVYGIDTEHISHILNESQYMQIHAIAQGLLPVAGTDGKIIDHISRVDKINVMEDDRGQVDFKQLNIIQNIKKGEPICTLVAPIPGIDGQNVSGKVIPCAKVVMPKTPMGNNTMMSADNTQLLAAMDGFASFQYDRFNVENKLVVGGNVDNSVGNINFIGDVYIRGDVLNGFEVRAGGDVHVAGMVEGAFIYAGKNVTIDKGMNGNKQGYIEAGGEVHCHFLENCTIHAIGSVFADSMVWCDVTSDDSIIVGPGKGAIIGGSIVACNSVTAQIIGNKSHQKTNITLGYSNKMLRERETTETELGESKNTLETLTKNITYLSKLQGLPPEKQELLNQLIHQKRLYEVKKKALLARLSDLDNQISDFTKCYVNGEMIFPPTQVTIGNASRTISNVWFKCHVYFSDGEIKFGTANE